MNFHRFAPDAIAIELKSDLHCGLEDAEASSRRKQFGPNELREAPLQPLWRRFLEQFKDLVVWILIAAAVVAGLLGDVTDTFAILAIVLLNGLIGFFQQERAEQAIAALRKLSSPSAKVIRDGQAKSVPAAELVPGDLIELEAGDYIPADARLLETFSLQIQEAALTGESTPVEKGCKRPQRWPDSQLMFSFACRSIRYTLPELGIHTNPHLLAAILLSALLQLGAVTLPFMQPLLEVAAAPSPGWLLILGLSLVPVSIVEIAKVVIALSRQRSRLFLSCTCIF